MKHLRLRLANAAVADILEQADWYEQQSGHALAMRWEHAVLSVIERLVAHPRSGASCNFIHEELQHIRRVSIDGFPKHSIFYQVAKRELVILRVAHGARDLESLF